MPRPDLEACLLSFLIHPVQGMQDEGTNQGGRRHGGDQSRKKDFTGAHLYLYAADQGTALRHQKNEHADPVNRPEYFVADGPLTAPISNLHLNKYPLSRQKYLCNTCRHSYFETAPHTRIFYIFWNGFANPRRQNSRNSQFSHKASASPSQSNKISHDFIT